MKLLKIAVIVLVVYAALVAAFEALLGYRQPRTPGSSVVITTFDAQGAAHERVVSRLESDGQLYVAANHWPRAWYRRALRNPAVRISLDGEARDYRAVPVSDPERARLHAEHPHGLVFRILTGFPPRRFLRLDPVDAAGGSGSS
jgi:hypothetical protein